MDRFEQVLFQALSQVMSEALARNAQDDNKKNEEAGQSTRELQ